MGFSWARALSLAHWISKGMNVEYLRWLCG